MILSLFIASEMRLVWLLTVLFICRSVGGILDTHNQVEGPWPIFVFNYKCNFVAAEVSERLRVLSSSPDLGDIISVHWKCLQCARSQYVHCDWRFFKGWTQSSFIEPIFMIF